MIRKIIHNRFWLPLVLILLLLVNWAASKWHARIDLTNEKRFTLSGATKKLLKKTDSTVTIDVFLKGDFPSGFRQLASSANDMLREFREVAGNKIQFSFISPDENVPGTETKYSDTLTSMGLYPINLTSQVKEGQQQQFVYPFALVHYGDKMQTAELYKGKTPLINFAELSSAEALLEYRFADAISKVTQKEKQTIGYLTGNGEPEDYRIYDMSENVLKQDYKLFLFNANSQQFIPQDFKAMIVVKPATGFSDIEKLKLDQYVMNGGRLIMFIDRLNAELDSLQTKNQVTAFDRDLKLNDLLFNYGARVNADLVMDLQCDFLPFDVNGNGQFELLPWNYFPVIDSKGNHPINKGLGFVSARFANSIDTVEAEGITKTILLSSSANARTIGSPAIISGAENVNAPEDEKFRRSEIPMAVLLEGKFHSMFNNRLSQDMRDSLAAANLVFMPQCIAGNKIIIVSDGDVVLNNVVKGNPIPMGMNPYTYGSQREFPFANKEFLRNCLEYLVNENNLSEAKAKDYTPRLLDPKKTAAQKTTWQLVNLVAPVIVILLFAFIFGWLRKRKYVK